MSAFPTDAERNDIDQAFGYVPEPEPLEHMLALVGRIVAAREAAARKAALREAQALIAFERSNAPEYTLTVGQQAAWRIGMARAHRLVRDRADRIEREATS